MSLSFGLNPWLLLLCMLIAAGLTYWTYHRTTPRLSAPRRAGLMALRFIALTLVLFLLFEPILRRLERITQPPSVALLVDTSQSLSLSGEGEGGAAYDLSETVRNALRQLPEDALNGDLRTYTFSSDVAPLDDDLPLDSLRFDGARTNLSRALDYVRDDLQNDNLGAVVVVSDGQYNTGRNPLYLAERYPVPIYTVAVGDTTARRDLQIRRVTTNEIAYVNNDLPIQVGLRADGFAGDDVAVTLLRDGTVLATTSVALPDVAGSEVSVDLSYTPTEEGLQRLTLSVTRLDGEVTYRNNTTSVTVRVLENRRRLLVLADAPSPDVSALRQMLATNPDLETTFLVPQAPGRFYEGTFPEDLTAFDVLVLAGFPSRATTPQQIRAVQQAAEDGVPLLFLLGRQTDLRLLQNTLGEVLPVTPQAVRTSFVEAAIVPSPRRHPILEIPDVPSELAQRLPPLFVSETRWQTSPDAQVLATIAVRSIELDDPLLVIRRRGQSRTAALLGAGTWRWHNVPEDLEAAAPYWPTLFDNLLQWVATREDDRLVRVAPVEDVFGGGEAVLFDGQVYDESLNPIDDAAVEVDVIAPDGARFPYTMESVGNGRYVLDVGALPAGTYRYEASAERTDVALGTDTGTFAVGALTLEFTETTANVTLLRQIAERSGGAYLESTELPDLPTRLASSESYAPRVLEETRENELWRRYPFLIAILLCLTLEWFFRKRSGMV